MKQANINNRWAQLSQNEKAELLGIYTRAGYNDLASIVAHYNSCGGKLKADGGPVINTAQYKSDAYLYNPPVNVEAPIEVPLRYKPLPNYGDYEYPVSTGMIQGMPIQTGYVTPVPQTGVLQEEALVPVVASMLDARKDAARRIMAVENSKANKEGGWDSKTGRWYPHKSHEGGADTIAYGIKLSNGTPEAALALKQGYLTDQQAEHFVDTLVQKYYDAAKRVYDGKYGDGEWDKLSDKSQSILVDYSYNPGLAKFPKLMEGFHSGDLDLIRKNYKRYVNGKELGRNKVLLEELDTLGDEYPIFRAKGGRIHIKPENRGKFTALKKRTGHSASWFKEHGTPAQKKMAVFALNARKWNHADGGPLDEENETQVNNIPNWTVFGTDYSTWKPSDIQNIIDWGYTDPESFFGEEGESTRNALSRAGMADSVIGDIYANMDPELQSKFGDRYKGTKQRQQEYTGGITNAIDSAGQRIYQIADTVAGFVPGPVGMIDWLGHMGADVAEGEFGKVGKDLALAAGLGFGARALGKGARYLKGYWDEIGNFGEDTFRTFTDRVPEEISTNFTYMLPAKRAITQAAVTAPYEIENLGGGYMLKSLMRGNPLEKQISKRGTVSVNNVKALAGKGSKVEQAVIDKVLASEEFAGKKSIDYNQFRKAVQDELITYERTPNTEWNNYGIDNLGVGSYMDAAESPEMRNRFNEFIMNSFSWDPTSDLFYIPGDPSSKSFDTNELAKMFFEDGPGVLYTPVGVTKELNTFTFSSPRIPNGSAKHYSPNTLGHSRTYVTTDEPDILHVMESQSDWAQGNPKISDRQFLVNNTKAIIDEGTSELNALESRFKEKYGIEVPDFDTRYSGFPKGWSSEQFDDYTRIDNLRYHLERDKENLLSATREATDAFQKQYLVDNYTSRQIQENLRYAAEKGQTKMRYPTRETAAKIEGYPKQTKYYTKEGSEIRDPYVYPDDVAEKIAGIQDEMERLDMAILGNSSPRTISDVDFYGVQNDKTSFERLLAAVKEDIVMNEKWMKDFGYADNVNGRVEKYKSLFNAWVKKFKTVYKEEPEIDELIEESRSARAKRNNLSTNINELLRTPKIINKHLVSKDVYSHEDILRKYTDFPKQFKKLYKNADIRTVTDPKGNTWYEVDVPENYLQQEWAYKNGGKLQQYADFSGFF